MAKKKKNEEPDVSSTGIAEIVEVTSTAPFEVVESPVLTLLSVDYGREDLNTIAMKINEIIKLLPKGI